MTNDTGDETRTGRETPAGPEESAERRGERITQQLAQQWAAIRAEKRAAARPASVTTGPTNFNRAEVPWGLDLAAAWSWRFLVIAGAGYIIAWTVARFAVVTVPVAVALLVAALVSPLVTGMVRVGLPRGPSTLLAVIATLGLVSVLLTFAGQQVVEGFSDLADQVVQGLEQIRSWLKDGPLEASDSQINDYIGQVQTAIADWSRNGAVDQAAGIGSAIGHITAGFFIVLFAMYFFLADGERIWSWTVRLTPRAARHYVDSSGRVAWVSLTQFVRATVVVAFVDAVGITLVAWWLDVPFVLAIGVLVFLGAFVPLIGATVAGGVAVLVALVDQGPLTALFMLIGVIVVQQIEGNILQPFLMGRFVAVHPLGVIIAIACGLLVAGVGGALIAVPLVAAVNAVVLHLADRSDPTQIAVSEAEQNLMEPDEPSVQEPSDDESLEQS